MMRSPLMRWSLGAVLLVAGVFVAQLVHQGLDLVVVQA